MELIVKSWVRYVVINHKCKSFSEGFLSSSLVSAKAFQSYWGGKILSVD